MELIDTVIDILQAFKSGKAIEYFDIQEHKYIETNNPAFIIQSLAIPTRDIRVKPEPKYRPYNSAEEFLKDSKIHGPYIKCPDDEYIIADRVNIKQIEWARRFCSSKTLNMDNQSLINKSFEDLLEENYTWQDGSVCGVIEE